MRTLVFCLALGSVVACRNDRGAKPLDAAAVGALVPHDAAPAAHDAARLPPADAAPPADDLDVPPTKFPTPTPEAVALVDAAAKVALPLCHEDRAAIVPADERTFERFVAALWMPPTAGEPEGGTFPFVATGAAITIWGTEVFTVMVVGDGSDPCKVRDVVNLTELGNPALKLTLINQENLRAVDAGGTLRGPDSLSQRGPGFVHVRHAQQGVGADVTAHVCIEDEEELNFSPSEERVRVRYFAIGSIHATWCPDTMLMP